jgi:hypothetical protein
MSTPRIPRWWVRCSFESGRNRDEGGTPASCHEETHAPQQKAFYSITSSAMARSDGGTVRPNMRAVVLLMTSSNLVDCSTGKSGGFAVELLVWLALWFAATNPSYSQEGRPGCPRNSIASSPGSACGGPRKAPRKMTVDISLRWQKPGCTRPRSFTR